MKWKPDIEWSRVKEAFSSFHAFHDAIRLKTASSSLSNEDLLPSPPEKRTWNTWNFFSYWWSESWAVAQWAVGAAMVTLGATVRDSILIVLFANLLSAAIIVANGRASASYHIGYPVLSRSSFGLNGMYFVVVIRALLGIIWGSVQLYYEGVFIAICLRCIFPSFQNMKNTIPANQHLIVQDLVGFVIAFVTTIPFMTIHTTQIRHVFTVKSIITPLACMGVVIWATTANGGVSADKIIDESNKTSTSTFAWGLVGLFNSVMGANSALLVTVPDIARYAKTGRSQMYGQALGLPLSQTICSSMGIIATAAVKNMYGKAYWNPYDLFQGILDNSGYSSGARAGVFFASAVWAFSALGTSLATNVAPFAADIASLAPKYINIIRGQFVWLIIAFAIVPWQIVASADGFLLFLAGYSIFQGCVVGIMVVDYFYVRRGNIYLPDLFTASSAARYHYIKGFNVRAFAAFIIGFALPFPGFIASFGHKMDPAATHMFQLGWALSFFVGSTSYAVICTVFKVPGDDGKHRWEEMVEPSESMVLAAGLDSASSPSEPAEKPENATPIAEEIDDPSKESRIGRETV